MKGYDIISLAVDKLILGHLALTERLVPLLYGHENHEN